MSFSSCQQQMEEQRKQTEAFVTAITKRVRTVPLRRSVFLLSCLSTQPRTLDGLLGTFSNLRGSQRYPRQPSCPDISHKPDQGYVQLVQTVKQHGFATVTGKGMNFLLTTSRTQFDPTRCIVRERFKNSGRT